MGLNTNVDLVFRAEVESQNMRLVRYPAAVAGVNIVSDGAAAAGVYPALYTQVVAAATVANPCWIVGLKLGVPQVEAFYGDIKIAIGALAAEVDLAEIPVGTALFAVVEWPHFIIWLPKPIKVLASPRVSVALRKSTGASAAGFNNCAVLAYTGIGN